jgi:hypothetical protein
MAAEDTQREDTQGMERRKEARYPVEANVIVRKKGGEAIAATAVDISSSGMRLRPCQSCPLDLDDEVSVEIELPEFPDKPFSSWGLGRIAYKNERGIGIQLFGGRFDPFPGSGSED